MSVLGHIPCPRCGAKLRADESLCPACLLDAASADGPSQEVERIFQAALELAPALRLPFVRKQTVGNAVLFSAFEMLLQGYEEAGGDAAGHTRGVATDHREEWVAASNEEPATGHEYGGDPPVAPSAWE